MTDTQPLPDPVALWEAVARRHPLEGVVYAVRSTGIYCRTDCPVRRPARGQVRFFGSPDEAERVGFRACLRCRPGTRRGRPTTSGGCSSCWALKRG